MISLTQIKQRLGRILDDLSEAAFAALAWIEEGDNVRALAVGRRHVPQRLVKAPVRSLRKSSR